MLTASPFLHDCSPPASHHWVALSVGNTHWQWGYFEGNRLRQTWKASPQSLSSSPQSWLDWCARSPAFQWHQQQGHDPFPPLRLASVVQGAVDLWQYYPHLQVLHLKNVPVANLYPGLGIDRALAVFGASQVYGWPVLVIDAGTALTFSGADQTGFQGGAIAPGLGLQLTMLHRQTSSLPKLFPTVQLPPRWARDTDTAIFSGVLLSVLSSTRDFCEDWIHTYPNSHVVFTGGDGATLLNLFQQYLAQSFAGSNIANYKYDEHLIFMGMAAC